MKVAVTGSTGLVGTALMEHIRRADWRATPIVRSGQQTDAVQWDPVERRIDSAGLEGLDAVVHLAGENIANRRWTQAQKDRIRTSRVEGTGFLAESLAALNEKPKVLVCASAIGFYGDRGDEILSEDATAGDGFLPEVCQAWESAADPAREAGIRVVHLRFGLILTRKGGALAKVLPLFRLGGGGIVGNGRQYWSWITLDDICGVILHAIRTDSLSGPVNAVAPNPVTNKEFTVELARQVRRWAIFPAPGFMLRIVLGEMADGLLMASARVQPNKLLESGYRFGAESLEDGLKQVLAS